MMHALFAVVLLVGDLFHPCNVFPVDAHRSLIFEVHFQELEVYFVKNKGLPMLFLAQCGQMTI